MVRRVHRQLSVEALGSWVSTCLVMDRAKCPEVWTLDAARRLLPDLGHVLDDGSVSVRLTAVAERPPLVKVPADTKELPPPRWEPAFLPVNRVLVVVSLCCGPGG